VSFNFFPANPRCHGKEFWDKIDYSLAFVKDNCALFAPTSYFLARAIRRCYLNFFPADLCCHGDEFSTYFFILEPRLSDGVIKFFYNDPCCYDN